MRRLDEQERDRVLNDSYTATFCTTNPNGTVHAVPVWYRYDGTSFWVATGADQRKTKNLAADPRASLSLLITKTETTKTVIGLVYGTATVHRWPLDQLKDKAAWIFSRYVDEAGVRQRIDPIPDGAMVAVEIKPDKILTWHP